MTVQFRPVSASGKVCWLNYGDNGVGKTELIGSGGRAGMDILIIRPPVDHVDNIIGSGCQEAVVRDWEDMDEVRSELQHVSEDTWDWVWLEGVSSWQDVGLNDVYQSTLDRAGPAGSAARKHRAQFYADKGEYRINSERISELVRDLASNEAFHFGITAWPFRSEKALTVEGEEMDGEQIQPWIQVRGMVAKVCGYMNIVSYMEVAERKRGTEVVEYRRLLTNKGPKHFAKCQLKTPDGTPIFGEDGIVINPTLPKIMEAIELRSTGARAATRNRTRPVRGRR